MSKRTSIGGQALIEGIMMKGPHKTTMAVRTSDGGITLEDVKEPRLRDKFRVFKLPVLRGAVVFIESLVTGYKALMRSADLSGFTEYEEDAGDKSSPRGDGAAPQEKQRLSAAVLGAVTLFAAVLGAVIAILLFIYLPALLFDLVNTKLLGGGITAFKGLFEGIIKIAVFVLYVYIVSLSKDIKRVFMYHGAEHKTIFCYEAGLELTPENAGGMKRFHPRCGTSFMILMLAVSILISSVIMIVYPPITHIRWLWVAVKFLLIPLTLGLGYELIKICGRYDNRFTRVISAPGMWLQRITTKEPTDDMLQIAIAAMQDVIPENEGDDDWK